MEKKEANQLQVIKKAEIFTEGKYKRMADEIIRDEEDEYVIDLKEHEKPITCEDYEKELEEKRLLEEREKNYLYILKDKLAKYKDRHKNDDSDS